MPRSPKKKRTNSSEISYGHGATSQPDFTTWFASPKGGGFRFTRDKFAEFVPFGEPHQQAIVNIYRVSNKRNPNFLKE